MSKSAIAAVISLMLCLSACGGKSDDPKKQKQRASDAAPVSAEAKASFKNYLIKSGTARFKVEGVMSGMEELYWDNWGMRTARYILVKSPAAPQVAQRRILIMDEQYSYTVNPDKKTAIRTSTRPKDVYDPERANVSDAAGAYKPEVTVLEEEKILGHPCKVVSITTAGQEIKQWVHKGVILKTTTTAAESGEVVSSVEAIAFEPDAEVSPAKLGLPEGLEIKTIGQLKEQVKRPAEVSTEAE